MARLRYAKSSHTRSPNWRDRDLRFGEIDRDPITIVRAESRTPIVGRGAVVQ